jgi:hypothetical protein
MSELFGGSRSLGESLTILTGNTCVRKLDRLSELGYSDEGELIACLSAVKAFCERGEKENLDAYRASVGDEYFRLLITNPKFSDMLQEFLKREFEALFDKAYRDTRALCEKYKMEEPPTLDEFKCMFALRRYV